MNEDVIFCPCVAYIKINEFNIRNIITFLISFCDKLTELKYATHNNIKYFADSKYSACDTNKIDLSNDFSCKFNIRKTKRYDFDNELNKLLIENKVENATEIFHILKNNKLKNIMLLTDIKYITFLDICGYESNPSKFDSYDAILPYQRLCSILDMNLLGLADAFYTVRLIKYATYEVYKGVYMFDDTLKTADDDIDYMFYLDFDYGS